MFEDSTFESMGRIRTRSRGWMVAALGLNSSIVLALVLVPLIYPEALPRQLVSILMTAPAPPTSAPPKVPQQAASRASADAPSLPDPMAPPRQIPPNIAMIHDAGPAPTSVVGGLDIGGIPGGVGDAFHSQPRVVHAEAKLPVRLPSALAAGLLIRKVVPPYPALAKATRTEGTVVLSATIAKDGTIANLRVVSGPAMLQEAALDAVSQWRYRPYLLNGDPVAVETTVNVVFTLQH